MILNHLKFIQNCYAPHASPSLKIPGISLQELIKKAEFEVGRRNSFA